ncbi:AAA family ATPase [Zunongwangia sp.]|uniref:AAA family ATPase n=1 Tax=Zunongwangia sp. TaxID=1965325 RepID=UPI003AA80883
MIKRINQIKKFGVFNDYRRSGDIQEFDKINIIYGWNYSGKTTISRIFQCFELNKLNSDYENCEFEIEDYNGHKLTQNDLQHLKIKVFNSDFIRDNIHLEGGNFNPVLLLGEDTKLAQEQLKIELKKIEKVKRIERNLIKESSAIEKSILDGLTTAASKIKDSLQIVQAFTRTHLKPIFEKVKSDHESYLLSETEFQKTLKTATISEENKLPNIDNFELNYDLKEMLEEAKTQLKKVPEFSSTIKHFIENPEIASWVEEGLDFHSENNSCEFCGNKIENYRLRALKAHFSKDLSNHKQELKILLDKIETKKKSIPEIKAEQFYPSLRADFKEKKKELEKEITNLNSQYSNLSKIIKQKIKNPFSPIDDYSQININNTFLKEAVSSCNDLISKNNIITKDFDEAKAEAQNTIKEYYAADYIEKISLSKKEQKIKLYKNRSEYFLDIEAQLEKSIVELESQISKAHKGKEKLNEFIEKFLGRNEIQVVVKKEEGVELFRLQRKDSKAVNLSEGEKTAIAFSFFLTKLLESAELENIIVYIDDPISSLDSNHIFQVNALIKEFFISKKDPDNESSQTKLNCNQLFISTHNFDFFGLLRELPKPSGSNKFYYYVRRIDAEKSTLEKLPKAIQNYSSEYHYLFELIYNFENDENKDYNALMGIPNAVRRFIELYTYARIPGNHNNSVDQRAEKLWGAEKSKRLLKVFHYFSHANNIERMMRNSDLMCDIENAVSDLHSLIKEDELHYSELIKTVNK